MLSALNIYKRGCKGTIFFLNSFLYLSAVLLHLPHPSIFLLNVLISSEKSSLSVLLSVTPHSNVRRSPWCGESLLRGRAGVSGRPLTHSSFLYLQSRECPDLPARPLPPQEAFSTPGRKPCIMVVSYRQKNRK